MIPYLKKYESFLIKNNSVIINPNEDLIESYSNSNPSIFIKHDVECNLNAALEMAKIEHKNNVSSIWLFQKKLLNNDSLPILLKIKELGHIIGYHYDVLDSNNGNYELAKIEFDEVLSWLNINFLDIKYICPHGNPSKARINYNSNKDFWVRYSDRYNLYDLVMDYNGAFFSDVSYGFYKINRDSKGKTFEELIECDFESYVFSGLSIVSIHSHRWSNNFFMAYFNYMFFHLVKFGYSKLKNVGLINLIADRLYKFSRYI